MSFKYPNSVFIISCTIRVFVNDDIVLQAAASRLLDLQPPGMNGHEGLSAAYNMTSH